VVALRLVALAGLSLWATAAEADPVTRWRPYTQEASLRFGVPVAWIERVLTAESGGMTTLNGRPITSPAGAMGLMQLMPDTWAELRAALGLGRDPHDPHDNIIAGTFYLRQMYRRFGYPGLFAAYNAGPARYAAYLGGRSSLPAETLAYVASVSGASQLAASRQPAMPPRPSLFAVHYAVSAASEPAAAAAPGGLFVRLSER
jgi:soluble lytic murein transglycosylase-like protein